MTRPMTRPPGPHPLPVFLGVLQAACADDPGRLRAALAGLARYQQAMRPQRPPLRPELARVGTVTLRGRMGRRPVVIVPSLINSAHVLDLPGRSLFAYLETAGMSPLLVDWGPAPEPLGLAALVADRLVPLVAGLERPVALVGYCLGGTMAMALVASVPAVRLALIAAPWHFAEYGDAARARLADWWAGAAPLAGAMGQLPIDLLQPAFWAIDPAGLAAKYARLATAGADDLAAFVALEDWANSGAPISLAAAADLAALFRTGAIGLSGAAAPDLPILDVVALRDAIVPAAAAFTRPGDPRRLQVDAGHVGMMVGGRARALLWDPLLEWLRAP
jgi:polyhydroxyalkanoate synthase